MIFSFLNRICDNLDIFKNLVLTRKSDLDLEQLPTGGGPTHKASVDSQLELDSTRGKPCFTIDEGLYTKYELWHMIYIT